MWVKDSSKRDSPATSTVILPVVSEATNDTSDDEVACTHSDCAGNQDCFSAEAVDIEDCWDGEEEF